MKTWLRFMWHCLVSGDRVTEYTSEQGYWEIGDVVSCDPSPRQLKGTHLILWKKKNKKGEHIYYLLQRKAH